MKLKMAALALFLPSIALANPPYDLRIDQPGTASTGGAAATYELWQDCTGTPTLVDADIQIPETYTGLMTADGLYNFCVRGRNEVDLAPVGLSFDVMVAALAAPGPIDSGTMMSVQCPDGPCTVVITPRSP